MCGCAWVRVHVFVYNIYDVYRIVIHFEVCVRLGVIVWVYLNAFQIDGVHHRSLKKLHRCIMTLQKSFKLQIRLLSAHQTNHILSHTPNYICRERDTHIERSARTCARKHKYFIYIFFVVYVDLYINIYAVGWCK